MFFCLFSISSRAARSPIPVTVSLKIIVLISRGSYPVYLLRFLTMRDPSVTVEIRTVLDFKIVNIPDEE